MRHHLPFPNELSFRKAAEFWWGVICEILGLGLKTLCGQWSIVAYASVIFFAVGVLLLILFFVYRREELQLELFRKEGTLRKRLLRWGLIGLAVLVSFGSPALLAKYGYIPYIKLQGQFIGMNGQDTVVLLFEDGQLASTFAKVEKDGTFQFSLLRRRVYRMVALRKVGNSLEMKEFTRDLASGNPWNLTFDVREGFFFERFLILKSAKCFFDTGKTELDSAAKTEIENFSNISPPNQYRFVVFGHADEVGGPSRNLELSKKRSLNTFTSLVENGMNGNKAILAFFGSERPEILGDSAAALAKNRRAEMMVIVRCTDSKEVVK